MNNKLLLIISIGLVLNFSHMLSQEKSVVTKTIEPTSWGEFPVVKSEHVKGGLHTVDDITARNAIPEKRRSLGMLVYVDSENKTYQLRCEIADINDNTKWVEVSLTGGALTEDIRVKTITTTGTPLVSGRNTLMISGDGANKANVNIDGVLTITDGNQAEGKILTSDASGSSSWQFLPELAIVKLTQSNLLMSNSWTRITTLTLSGIETNPAVISSIGNGTIRINKSGLFHISWTALNITDGRIRVNGSTTNYAFKNNAKSGIDNLYLNAGDELYLQLDRDNGDATNNDITFTVAQYGQLGGAGGGTQNIEEVIDQGNDANGKTITGVLTPTDASATSDIANKEYVDNQYRTINLGNFTNGASINSDCSNSRINFRATVTAAGTVQLENPTNMQSRTYTWFIENTSGGMIEVRFGSNFRALQGSAMPTCTDNGPNNATMIIVAKCDAGSPDKIYYSISKYE